MNNNQDMTILTIKDVIDKWPSVAIFADDMGIKVQTAWSWYRRESIPGSKWIKVVDKAKKRRLGITLKLLADLAAE